MCVFIEDYDGGGDGGDGGGGSVSPEFSVCMGVCFDSVLS